MSLYNVRLTSEAVITLGSCVLLVYQVLVAVVSVLPLCLAGFQDTVGIVELPGEGSSFVPVLDVSSVVVVLLTGLLLCNLQHVVGAPGAVVPGKVDPLHQGGMRFSQSVYSASFSVCSCVHVVSEISVLVDVSNSIVVADCTGQVYFLGVGCKIAVPHELCVVLLDLSCSQHGLSVLVEEMVSEVPILPAVNLVDIVSPSASFAVMTATSPAVSLVSLVSVGSCEALSSVLHGEYSPLVSPGVSFTFSD